MILIFVFLEMEVITAGPLEPQPIMPILIAELAFDPNAVDGLINVIAETAAVFCKKSLLFIPIWFYCCVYSVRSDILAGGISL